MKPNRFTDNTQKPFHSHTYAEVGNGASLGSASAETFSQRYRVDQNRQHIAKYRDSFIARSGYSSEERMNGRESTKTGTPVQTEGSNRQAFNAGGVSSSGPPRSGGSLQVPRRGYSEPPTRNYNPFS